MIDDECAERIHACFLDTAAEFSEPLRTALEGVGPPGFPDRGDVPLAQFLARAVVGQQLSTKAARSIWARVESAAAGEGVAVLALLDEDRYELLRACGISRNKIRALAALGSARREGLLDGETLAAMDHESRSQLLREIRGVGQWTCDMASIFWCRSQDVWPETDLAVRNTFVRLIGRRRKPAKAAARFSPRRSWLALYMWKVADARPD